MKRILFVCLGNICRSPMAEMVFKYIVQKNELEDKFYIDSAATCRETTGYEIYYETQNILNKYNIPYTNHKARQLKKEDYDNFDYIIGMDEMNLKNIKRIVGQDTENKIYKLLDFTESTREIDDPYYTRDFEKTYEEVTEGCEALLKRIINNG